MAGGTHNGNLIIPQNSETSLGPLYITGDLEVGKDSVITLAGTIYVEGIAGHMPSYDIYFSKDCEVSGEGSLVAVGNIYLQKVADYGTTTDTVIMSLTGNITFKKEANVDALIYAPEGSVTFDKEATIHGGVLASYIQADMVQLFQYDPSFYDGFRLPSYIDARFRLLTYDIFP